MTVLRKIPPGLIQAVKSGGAKVYGGIIKDASSGRILGHLEETGVSRLAGGVLSGNPLNIISGGVQATSSVVGNVQNHKIIGQQQVMIGQQQVMIKQLTQIGSKLSTVATLGWVNIGMSAVSIGVTAVGMVVLSKKMNKLSDEVRQISSKIDSMDLKLNAIKLGVDRINENATRDLNRKYTQLVTDMIFMIDNLNSKDYSDYLDIEVKKLLSECSAFLDDMIKRFEDGFEILITMEQIMTFYVVYNSFAKAILTKSYLSTEKVLNPMYYQTPMRSMCSNDIIKALQYQASKSAKSVLVQQELNCIGDAFKTAVGEQVKMIKASEQIIQALPYKELRTVDEFLSQNYQTCDELAYVQY